MRVRRNKVWLETLVLRYSSCLGLKPVVHEQIFFDDVSNFLRLCTKPANYICWCCCHPAAGSRNDALSLEEEGGTPYKMVVKLAARADFCQIFFDGFVHEQIFGKWIDEKLCMLAFVKFSFTNENAARVPSHLHEQIFFDKWHLSTEICTTGLSIDETNRLKVYQRGSNFAKCFGSNEENAESAIRHQWFLLSVAMGCKNNYSKSA